MHYSFDRKGSPTRCAARASSGSSRPPPPHCSLTQHPFGGSSSPLPRFHQTLNRRTAGSDIQKGTQLSACKGLLPSVVLGPTSRASSASSLETQVQTSWRGAGRDRGSQTSQGGWPSGAESRAVPAAPAAHAAGREGSRCPLELIERRALSIRPRHEPGRTWRCPPYRGDPRPRAQRHLAAASKTSPFPANGTSAPSPRTGAVTP